MLPLIHLTDLYHPPQDPDDHVDLATIYGLPEIDLRAVILDQSRRALRGELNGDGHTLDPGYVPVSQLNYLTGRAVPFAAGPIEVLSDPGDTAADRPPHEQGGVELILRTLRESEAKVCVSIVSSVRPLIAAFNREPELVRAKVDRVLLNAGSSGSFVEWNVELDRAAYIGLMRSGLPIDWYPCANEKGPCESDARNTWWSAPQENLFRDLPAGLRAWFCYAFSHGNRADIIRAMHDPADAAAWQRILSESRNVWSTASLVMAAGRTLTQTASGWRFLPSTSSMPSPWSMEDVAVTIRDDGVTTWSHAAHPTGIRLFRREIGPAHDAAMTEALNALLRGIALQG